MRVQNNSVVTLEYKMVDKKGTLIDSSDHADPLVFIHGLGTLLPAIEKRVEGCQAGERLTFTLSPEESFGEHHASRVKVIPRSQFQDSETLRVGQRFFTHKNGNDLPVIITAVDEEEVTVDGNHPLAGEEVNIDLVVVSIREATPGELESGKVESDEEIYAAAANDHSG